MIKVSKELEEKLLELVNSKEKKIPSKYYLPKSGDLVLFPSSLFHGTVPCESEEERQVVAFDLRPN